MVNPTSGSLNGLSDADRIRALERFQMLRPFLEEGVALRQVSQAAGISLRTARYWVKRYRKDGLAGLIRKVRFDKDQPRFSSSLQQAIEGMALQKPKISAATVHRKAIAIANKLGEQPPSYSFVYSLIRRMDPALVTMAHEGTKAYSEAFDLIYRREAKAPNAIWQADHTELDILVKDEQGKPQRPWLTVILDDYSQRTPLFGKGQWCKISLKNQCRLSVKITVAPSTENCGLRHGKLVAQTYIVFTYILFPIVCPSLPLDK